MHRSFAMGCNPTANCRVNSGALHGRVTPHGHCRLKHLFLIASGIQERQNKKLEMITLEPDGQSDVEIIHCDSLEIRF
jgi:hypothetical protein